MNAYNFVLFFFCVFTSFPTKVYSQYNKHEPPTWTPSVEPPPTQLTATLPGNNIHKTPQGTFKFPDTVTIHSALKSGQNITSLNLRVALLGCSEWPDRWSLPFDQAGHDTYQPLNSLCLEEYSFSDNEFETVQPPKGRPVLDSYLYEWQNWLSSGRATKWWRYRQLDLTQRSKTNAELWADAMDWSKLEKLELRDISGPLFIKHISPKLTGLQELTLDNFRPGELTSTSQWIANLSSSPSSLKKLTWLNGCDTTDESLDLLLGKHGSTLETLSLHPTGMMGGGNGNESPYLTPSQINKIATQTPNLTNLSIALNRNGTWPLESFEALSQIPTLVNLEIWMQYISDMGLMADSDSNDPHLQLRPRHYEILSSEEEEQGEQARSELYQKPFLNETNVNMLWAFMRNVTARNPGFKLKTVRFNAGDFTRGWDGPLYLPDWYEGLRKSWVCGYSDSVVGGGGKDGGCKEDYGRESDVFAIQADIDHEHQPIFW